MCVCTMNACVCVYMCVGVHALVYLCMCASEYAHMLFLLPEGTLWGARGCGTAAGTPELSSGCGGGAPPPQLTLFSSNTLKTNVANLVGSPNGKNCL